MSSDQPFVITAQLKRMIAALLIGGLAAIFDSTIVAIALPTLVTDLNTNVATIQWVSTGYLLALAVAIPLVGWGQARFGGKRMWIFALALFMVGSILCSLAWDPASLITFRVIQGIGGGLMLPLMQSILISAAGGTARGGGGLGSLMAIISLPIALGPILGPVIGGIILNWLPWNWLFWVNVPLCIVGLVLAALLLPSDKGATSRPVFDILGFVMLSPALAGLLYGLTNTHQDGGFGRLDVWLPLAIGVVLLVGFIVYAWRRGEKALVDMQLFRRPIFSRASGLMFFSGMTLYGVMLLLPLYWQGVRGLDVLTAAIYLIPQGVGSLLSRVLAGRLVDRLGARSIAVIGFVIVLLGTLPFAFADASTNVWWLMAVLLVRGIGLGGVLIPVMSVAYVGLEPREVPHASMITRIAQQVGGSFGTAVLAVVLQAATKNATTPGQIVDGFQVGFWVAVGITVAAILVAFLLPGKLSRVASVPAPTTQAVAAD